MYEFMYNGKISALQLLSEPYIALKQISFPVQPAWIKTNVGEIYKYLETLQKTYDFVRINDLHTADEPGCSTVQKSVTISCKVNVEEGKAKAEVAEISESLSYSNGEVGKSKTGDDGDSERAEERKHRITTTLLSQIQY